MLEKSKEYRWGIFQLWLNWLSGSGAIAVLIILSLWVRPLYMPFVAFGLQLILFTLIRRNREKKIPSCYILPFIASRVLFWSAVVMIIINILYSNAILDLVFDRTQVNKEIPFICALIVYPIAAAIAGWGYLNRNKISFCRDCRMRYGTPSERGFLGVIFTQIGHYQLGMLFWITAVPAVIAWAYYLMLYVNESLNVPDRFVFFLFPTLLWIASAIYLALRYLGIYAYYRQNVEGSLNRRGVSTQIRFIIIHDSRIALCPPETDSEKGISLGLKIDTPISAFVHKMNNVTIPMAESYFYSLSGIKNVEIRRMYVTPQSDLDSNIFHFFAFMTDEQKEEFSANRPECGWFTLKELAEMINTQMLNPLLSAELTRLYTIATTYKTYFPDGKRRYKVKHYRPSTDIANIKNLDVDFNDSHWLYVADNNQDTPFYTIRRFWRKYINGIDR